MTVFPALIEQALVGVAAIFDVTVPVPVAGGPAVSFTFTVSLDASAGNTYQNISASQPLVWTLST